MQDILKLSAVELGKKIAAGEITSVEATKAYLDKIGAVDKDINAYITVCTDKALKEAEEADKKIASGELAGPLAGVPVAIKDNMCIEGTLTTCASHILDNFVPTYTSTAVEKLKVLGFPVRSRSGLPGCSIRSPHRLPGSPIRSPHRLPGFFVR